MSEFRPLRDVVNEAEKNHILAALAATDRIKLAAALLDITPRSLIIKRQKHNLPLRNTGPKTK